MPADWTPDDLPDLRGQTVVVTGANSGVGKAATGAFAGAGADVVMACRSVERGEAARADLLEAGPTGSLAVAACDLADLDSVADAAAEIAGEHGTVEVLCNNAGVMAIPRRETADGFEYQFGVNHLGHVALTAHLLGSLLDADAARVVTQSSILHWLGRFDFEDLHGERRYRTWRAYAQSKLANLSFAIELQRRLDAAGHDHVRSLASHPGWAATNLQRRGPEARGSTVRLRLMGLANRLLGQPAERGAWPMLYAATADDLPGGAYVGPDGWLGLRGAPSRARPSGRARDPEAAARLWRVSEALTGVTFDL